MMFQIVRSCAGLAEGNRANVKAAKTARACVCIESLVAGQRFGGGELLIFLR
jgi:hypothetical protein